MGLGGRRRSSLVLLAAGALCVTVLAGCATPQPAPSPSETTAPAAGGSPLASTTLGVVEYGTGPKTVDLYVDPLCPYCRHFEQLSGPMLLREAEAGTLTLRVHPVSILDRLSNETRYSTRAAAAVLTVAAAHPDAWPAFLKELFANQPEENGPGLTDEQLEALTVKAGTPVTLTGGPNPMETVVAEATAEAGRLGMSQVPTVLVDGEVFRGGSQDAAEFESFYNSH